MDVPQSAQQRAEAAAIGYLSEIESGQAPERSSHAAELDPEAREVFDQLLDSIALAKESFPNPLRPLHVLAGRYELRTELGSGGFGRVWRAFDRTLEIDVAVKVMDLLTNSAVQTETFHTAERKALAQVKHPGVVKILDAGSEDDKFFLVMELVDGVPLDRVIDELRRRVGSATPGTGTLAAVVERPRLAGQPDLLGDGDYFRNVATILRSMLETLDGVHSAGIVHRDIKPSNVMLCGGGLPKLMDFGMAALREARTALTSRLVGTVNYIAPEQLREHRTGSSVSTDVYEVGLVMYELLTLRRAFDPTDPAVVDRIRRGDFVPPRKHNPKIPRALDDICLKACELDPGRRYRSAKEFAEDLAMWLDGRAVPVASRRGRFGTVVRDLRYTARRNRVAMFVAAALLVGFTVAYLLIPPPKVIMTKSRLSTTRSTLAVSIEADRKAYVFGALEVATAADPATKLYVPLRASPDRDYHEVPAGAGHQVEFESLAQGLPAFADFPQQSATIISAYDETKRVELEAEWRRCKDRFLEAYPAGLPASLFVAATTRGDGPELKVNGEWVRGITSDTRPLEPPR